VFPALGAVIATGRAPEYLGNAARWDAGALAGSASASVAMSRVSFAGSVAPLAWITAWIGCQLTAVRFAVLPVFVMHSWG